MILAYMVGVFLRVKCQKWCLNSGGLGMLLRLAASCPAISGPESFFAVGSDSPFLVSEEPGFGPCFPVQDLSVGPADLVPVRVDLFAGQRVLGFK